MSVRILVWAALSLFAEVASAQTSYRVKIVAGSDSVGDGGLAVAALLQQAQGIATDALGFLYVSDAAAHRVRRISPAGVIETIAGTGALGFAGDGGPATLAQLNSPYGLAVGANRVLYIADLGNHCVRRVGVDGVIQTVAGGGSTPVSVAGNGQYALGVQFTSPRNVAIDLDGSLLVADFAGQRVARITSAGTLSIVAGTGQQGFAGDGALATSAQLNFPAGLAVDATGVLYIADSGNKRVRRITKGVIDSVNIMTKSIALVGPTGVSVDSSGTMYIADAVGSQCLKGTPAGWTALPVSAQDVASRGTQTWILDRHQLWLSASAGLTLVGGNGTSGYYGSNIAATAARMQAPAGIVGDVAGNLYFADSGNHCVRRIDPAGVITTVAGTGITGYTGDQGPAVQAKLKYPTGLALDAAGNLYISDTGNNCIRRVTVKGTIQTIAGTGIAGTTGDGGLATNALLSSPAGLAADRDGSLYVADAGNHCIRKISAAGLIDTVVGTKTAGFGGDGGLAIKAQLNAPLGIALDASGLLYVADTKNNVVRRIDNKGVISTLAASVPSPWSLPQAVALGPDGSLWVADSGNARIAAIDAQGHVNTIAPVADSGTFSFGQPVGIWVNASGVVEVSDAVAQRIFGLSPSAAVSQTPNPPAPPVTPPTPSNPVTFQVVQAGSNQTSNLAPGQMVSLYGKAIGPAVSTSGNPLLTGALPTGLAGVQVQFNGIAAPVFLAQPDQITVQVPYEVSGHATADVAILTNGVRGPAVTVPVAETAPALFTVSSGVGPAIAWNTDGSLNSDSSPSPGGSIIVLYATGEGQTAPASTDGVPAAAPYAPPAAPMSVTIGGQPAEILFAGRAPGLVGLLQLNVRVPMGVKGTLECLVTAGTAVSPSGITIEVR